MPPLSSTLRAYPARFIDSHATPSRYAASMRAQWRNPNDILSVLMVLGGDIVQVATAQLAATGPFPFAPVAFSFGWLAYSISALLSALGDGHLLPPPEYSSKLINAKTKYERDNQSWVLCRLLRDEEPRLQELVRARDSEPKTGLIIAFYRPAADAGEMGEPARDGVYWLGVAVIAVQNFIATIPWWNHGNWVVFLVTFVGTILALSGTALPQWRSEKYPARPINGKQEVYCLTRGNGASVVMVFILERGLRLEDLAGAKHEHHAGTLVATITLSTCWILLLLAVEGLDGDGWFLLGIGGLGMIQNILAAGARRSPGALGFPLMREDSAVLHKESVMETLKDAENKRAGVGLSLLNTFFPGDLRDDEMRYWEGKRLELEAAKAAARSGGPESKASSGSAKNAQHPPDSSMLKPPSSGAETGSLASDAVIPLKPQNLR